MAHTVYRDMQHYMTERGLSQTEIAKELGVSKSFVSKLLKKKRYPGRNVALRIVKHCKVPILSLFT